MMRERLSVKHIRIQNMSSFIFIRKIMIMELQRLVQETALYVLILVCLLPIGQIVMGGIIEILHIIIL